jgi:hypothetical protein
MVACLRSCSTKAFLSIAERRTISRGSSRRWMKLQWQVNLKINCAIATRNDQLADSFLGMLFLASARELAQICPCVLVCSLLYLAQQYY